MGFVKEIFTNLTFLPVIKDNVKLVLGESYEKYCYIQYKKEF